MQVLALLVLALVLFGLEQAWKRHRIRTNLAVLGRTIVEIRWMPLAGFSWLRARRDTSSFRVSGTTRDGARFDCLCVASVLGDVSIHDEPRIASPVSGWRPESNSFQRQPAPRGNFGDALIFHGACAVAALVAFLGIGVSYWTPPYRSLQLPNGLFGFGLAALVVFAFGLASWRRDHWIAILAWMTSAVVAVVVVRIANDLAADPSTHNLLPFELAIALFVGAAAAALGIGLARALRLATLHAA